MIAASTYAYGVRFMLAECGRIRIGPNAIAAQRMAYTHMYKMLNPLLLSVFLGPIL